MEERNGKVRIAAVADIHIHKSDKGKWAESFKAASDQADILLLCGDLTDTGDIEEAKVLANELHSCRVPVLAVLGNHDYEKNQQEEVIKILKDGDVHVLDGESIVVEGIGFAGIKGFGGGFGRYSLPMWGEKMNKEFVNESVQEALRLDQALTKISSKKKIVLLHYAPIPETLAGEPEQIFPFLGSSRLSEPIDQRQVEAVFHGHAHYGTLQGETNRGVKVFNVSKSILKKEGYEKQFFIYETEA